MPLLEQGEFLTPRWVVRGLAVGFALVVALVIAAVFVGYTGSRAIHDSARELVREHLLTSPRGAALELRIEQRSQQLLDQLELVLGLCLLLAIACAVVAIWTTRRAFERLEWQAEELGRVSWQMLEAQERTARRFSHEMHDELGQTLTGLRGMLKRLPADQLDIRRAECVGILDEALTGVRELSQLLRPVILDDFGVDAGLQWLCDGFAERTGLSIRYASNVDRRLVEEDETHFFRVAQEALTNTARHAHATRVEVSLHLDRDVLALIVEDDGCGLPTHDRPRPSLGMVGMRARARHMGGQFTIVTRREGGVRLTVRAPARWAKADDDDKEDTRPAR